MKIPTQSNNARFFTVSSVLQLEHFIRKSELFTGRHFVRYPAASQQILWDLVVSAENRGFY
jgi:hypothetical protein